MDKYWQLENRTTILHFKLSRLSKQSLTIANLAKIINFPNFNTFYFTNYQISQEKTLDKKKDVS